jgi:hypothetical protein
MEMTVRSKFGRRKCWEERLEDKGIGGRIILKLLLNTDGVKVWAGFNFPIMDSSDGMC